MVELAHHEIFDEAAFKRVRLGMGLLMTAVDIPLVWMGEEFGEYKPKTIESAKIDWSLLGNDANRNLFEYVKGLTALRQQNRALQTVNMDFFHENAEDHVLAYGRWNEEGSRVVVVANFSDQYRAGYALANFPANGTWHEWGHDYDVSVEDNCLVTDLAEYEAKVFVWQP